LVSNFGVARGPSQFGALYRVLIALDGFSARPSALARDLRIGVRRLSKAPLFTFFAIATLALGIGSTTAAYSMVAVMFSSPAGFDDIDRIVVVGTPVTGERRAPLSSPDFEDLRSSVTSLAALEAETGFLVSLATDAGPASVNGMLVTAGYFQMLGVRPILGRLLAPHDSEAVAAAAVVLSEPAWRRYFGSDPAIVGRVVSVGGAPYEVVGVAPRVFRGVGMRSLPPAFWTPATHTPQSNAGFTAFRDPSRRDRAYLQVAGRMNPDVDRARVDAELGEISRRLDEAAPLVDRATRPAARGWTTAHVSGLGRTPSALGIGAIIMLMPVLVLLVACTNLANLVLSRGAARRNELIVRRALGASRWSLIRADLMEHGLLALAGGFGGVLVAHVLITSGLALVTSVLGSTPQTALDVRIDGAALVVAAAAAAVAVTIAALLPAVRLTRRGVEGQPQGEMAAGLAVHWRGRRRLIAFQVAASLALLLVTALCLRQVIDVRARRDVDVDLARIAVVTVEFGLRTHDPALVAGRVAAILSDVARSARIDSAAVANGLPAHERNARGDVPVMSASAEVFRVLGLPVRAGRVFLPDEAGVAVISESESVFAFGTRDGVGRELTLPSATVPDVGTRLEVVGVVADVGRDESTHEGLRQVYVPYRGAVDATRVSPSTWLLARATGDDAGSASTVLASAVRRADPDVPIRFTGRADIFVNGPGEVLGFVSQVIGGLAVLALVLSASGLYGVTSFLVASRTREMGIRIALGADRESIVRLVMRDAARPVVTGLAIGIVAAAITRVAMRPLFSESSIAPFDWLALVVAALPLMAAAAVACYVPARRAASVDPNVALRQL
jgi:putative ABC transport system permease protein